MFLQKTKTTCSCFGCDVELTEVTWWVVRQVPVKFSAMSLLQSCAQAKI